MDVLQKDHTGMEILYYDVALTQMGPVQSCTSPQWSLSLCSIYVVLALKISISKSTGSRAFFGSYSMQNNGCPVLLTIGHLCLKCSGQARRSQVYYHQPYGTRRERFSKVVSLLSKASMRLL